MNRITADILLEAYICGVFPMAETRDAEDLFWVDPKERGILPLDKFHIPKSLIKTLRKNSFTVTVDTAFPEVIRACAAPRAGHDESWINGTIMGLYEELFARGQVHSVECWQEDKLVGGLYGVSIGQAFFGESMFSLKTDASKIALCYLIARLKTGGYTLLDTQFVTEHLSRFGVMEIERDEYLKLLNEAIIQPADFHSLPSSAPVSTILQLITQIS
jgi:leucyl/phenylalanyl-tRNA--protein transferase